MFSFSAIRWYAVYVILRYPSADFGSIGNTDDMLNGLMFVPSVTDMNVLGTLVTVTGPCRFFYISLKTRFRSAGE